MNTPKKIILLLVLCILFSGNAFALKKIKGYYIPMSKTKKISVTFLVPTGFLSGKPNYEKMQTEIECLDGAKKVTLSPSEVQEFGFTYKGKSVLMRSVYDNLEGYNSIFLHAVVDGPVCLYDYYQSSYGPMTTNPSTGMMTGGGKQTSMLLVLQYKSGELVKIRRLFFRKDMTDFFADCASVVEKIKSSTLSDMEAIVMEYNKSCH